MLRGCSECELLGHKISEQCESLYLSHVHLLSDVCHMCALCSLHLPREVLNLYLQLGLLVLKL